MSVDAKGTFAEIVYNLFIQDAYGVRICGVDKTREELYDLNTLYAQIYDETSQQECQ